MELHLHMHPGAHDHDLHRLAKRALECAGSPPGHSAELVTKQDLEALETRIMFTLDQTLEEIRATRTVIDGLDVLLDNYRANIAEILSGAKLAPAVQAKVDQAGAELIANKAKLSEVLLENTPQESPPPSSPSNP